MGDRLVVLLCGPPGAGKTTAARASGLAVYDRDDAKWGSDSDFVAALRAIGADRNARAVVIRSGATSDNRRRTAEMVDATHVYLVTTDRAELAQRVATRGRHDKVRTLAGIDRWIARFDRADGVRDFPGWGAVSTRPDLGAVAAW